MSLRLSCISRGGELANGLFQRDSERVSAVSERRASRNCRLMAVALSTPPSRSWCHCRPFSPRSRVPRRKLLCMTISRALLSSWASSRMVLARVPLSLGVLSGSAIAIEQSLTRFTAPELNRDERATTIWMSLDNVLPLADGKVNLSTIRFGSSPQPLLLFDADGR